MFQHPTLDGIHAALKERTQGLDFPCADVFSVLGMREGVVEHSIVTAIDDPVGACLAFVVTPYILRNPDAFDPDQMPAIEHAEVTVESTRLVWHPDGVGRGRVVVMRYEMDGNRHEVRAYPLTGSTMQVVCEMGTLYSDLALNAHVGRCIPLRVPPSCTSDTAEEDEV